MSTNGDAEPPRNHSQTPTPALDVSFSTLGDRNGESSSSRHHSRIASKSPRRSTSHHRIHHRTVSPANSPGVRENSHKRHGRHKKEDNNGSASQSRKSRHSFLLDSFRSNGHSKDSPASSEKSNGKKRQHEVQTTPEARRSAAYSRQSNDASSLGSPLSKELRSDSSWAGQIRADQRPSMSPAMSPAQLVQMALSLSESRKRHVSNSLRIPIPASGPERRVVSAAPNLGTVRGRPAERQRVAVASDDSQSSAISPRNSAQESRELSDPFAEDAELQDDSALYSFSPATLSRAEKARRYFELASEHRRLLQYLPPMKLDTAPAGHHRSHSIRASFSTRSDSIQDGPDHTHEVGIGRQYNPLQALRNRRVRLRERKPLTVPINSWQDTRVVKEYVDSVMEHAEPGFSNGATKPGMLPLFPGDEKDQPAASESGHGRARGNTTGSVITRPENEWFIEPAELLADTYWTEKMGNRHFIEDRRSQRIFPKQRPDRQSMERARQGHGVLRHSTDYSQITDEASDLQYSDNEASATDRSKKNRRHRLRLPLHGIDHVRKKRLSRMRAGSDSSVSSLASSQLKGLHNVGEFTNIRPLEKHMAQMIEQDEKGHLSSPDLVSPDHWDSRNMQFPAMRNRADSITRRASITNQQHQSNNHLAPHTTEHHGHRRTKSADGRMHDPLNRTSTKDYESSVEPNSPLVQSHFPSFGMDISSPVKKGRNKRISKLKNHFRSDSKERNHVDHMDFAEAHEGKQPKALESDTPPDAQTTPRFSFDAPRPALGPRQKTAESQINNLRPTTSREPSSTVGRMFKNPRLAGLVRTESRFRYKDKFGDVGSSAELGNISDVEGRSSGEFKPTRPRLASTASDGLSPRHSFEGESRPKLFNQNMPTFVSAVRGRGRDVSKSPMASGSNSQLHSRTPSQLRSDDKSDRPQYLVVPEGGNRSQLSLTNSNRGSKPSGSFTPRSNKVYFDEGVMDRMRSPSGKHASHRAWSISQQSPRPHEGKAPNSQTTRISNRDLVRCRALILASGIKAREIKRLAESPRSYNDCSKSDLALALAVPGTATPPGPVARKDESLTAGHLLSSTLSATLQDLDNAIRRFHSTTCPSLLSDMQELKHIASDQLTNTCHEASDEADAFMAQLATEFTMDVKNVEDSVEAMVRRRNRRFRMLRRTGFKGLEWTVLAVMWAIWFVVVVFNAGRKTVVAVVSLIRWLLWF